MSKKRKNERKQRRQQKKPKADAAALDGAPPVRAELWTHLADAMLLLLMLEYAYLYMRPGGDGALWVFLIGRDILAMSTFTFLGFALLYSALRRPFLRPGRMRSFVILAFVTGAAPFPILYPSSHEDQPSEIAFELPVKGEWQVFWGGLEPEENRLARFFTDQRFGMHLVPASPGARFEGEDRTRPESYAAWDQPVLAPAAGTVVALRADVDDHPVGARVRDGRPLGNYVALRVAAGEFLFVSHLRQGSIAVNLGDAVALGSELGRVGFSGLTRVTPEPHVAIHLQDTALEGWGEPIPWAFQRYFANGALVETGLPTGGIASSGALQGQVVRRATN